MTPQIRDAPTPTGTVAFELFINKPQVGRRLGKQVRTVDNWMQHGLLLLQEREVGGVQVERSGTAVEPTLPREQGGRS